MVRVGARVRRALARREPVVTLESSVFAQGLPHPANADAARRMTGAIAQAGAVPAITALLRGVPVAGLSSRELAQLLEAGHAQVVKVTARDLAAAAVRRVDGATTVASTLVIARLAGIDVFATGGIGGVHRGNGYDESADLVELSRIPAIVVCSGAKAILDVAATVERLETLGVTVVGYRTDRMPAFYTESTDLPVTIRLDTAAEIAELFDRHLDLHRPGAILVVQPPPPGTALPRRTVESAVARGLRSASRAGVAGPAVTPWLLRAVEEATGGRSVAANVVLLESNARLAAEVAVALALARNNR